MKLTATRASILVSMLAVALVISLALGRTGAATGNGPYNIPARLAGQNAVEIANLTKFEHAKDTGFVSLEFTTDTVIEAPEPPYLVVGTVAFPPKSELQSLEKWRLTYDVGGLDVSNAYLEFPVVKTVLQSEAVTTLGTGRIPNPTGRPFTITGVEVDDKNGTFNLTYVAPGNGYVAPADIAIELNGEVIRPIGTLTGYDENYRVEDGFLMFPQELAGNILESDLATIRTINFSEMSTAEIDIPN